MYKKKYTVTAYFSVSLPVGYLHVGAIRINELSKDPSDDLPFA